MTYLLDTHVFLWLATAPELLSPTVLGITEQDASELLLSAASGWEIALLWKLDRIELPEPPALCVPAFMQALRVTPFPIGFSTAMAAATLPLIHRDPFDRILVAEAMRNNLALLSKDATLARYDVHVLW